MNDTIEPRRVRRFRTADAGTKVVILGPPGRVWTQAVAVDIPIRLFKIANGDVLKYCTEVQNAPAPRRACKQMLRIGKDLGITKGAKTFLRAQP